MPPPLSALLSPSHSPSSLIPPSPDFNPFLDAFDIMDHSLAELSFHASIDLACFWPSSISTDANASGPPGIFYSNSPPALQRPITMISLAASLPSEVQVNSSEPLVTCHISREYNLAFQVNPNVLSSHCLATLNSFSLFAVAFIAFQKQIYDDLEQDFFDTLFDEPYSLGYLQSCYCAQLAVLEEMCSFLQPADFVNILQL